MNDGADEFDIRELLWAGDFVEQELASGGAEACEGGAFCDVSRCRGEYVATVEG